jgi:hypothetical protein
MYTQPFGAYDGLKAASICPILRLLLSAGRALHCWITASDGAACSALRGALLRLKPSRLFRGNVYLLSAGRVLLFLSTPLHGALCCAPLARFGLMFYNCNQSSFIRKKKWAAGFDSY